MPKYDAYADFAELNKRYFGGRLPKLRILIYKRLYQKPGRKVSYKYLPGSSRLAGAWRPSDKTIRLASTSWGSIKHSDLDMKLTLVHEMLHAHDCLINKDYRGHNNDFKKTCKRLEQKIVKTHFKKQLSEFRALQKTTIDLCRKLLVDSAKDFKAFKKALRKAERHYER